MPAKVDPVFVAIAAACFSAALAVFLLDPVLVRIVAEYEVAPATAFLVSAAFALPYALAQPLIGLAGDYFGRTRIFILCFSMAVLSTLATGLVSSFELLIAARAANGLFTAGVFPLGFAIVSDQTEGTQRQVTLARLSAFSIAGSLGGSILAGAMSTYFHWSYGLYAAGLVGTLAIGPTVFLLRKQFGPVRAWAPEARISSAYHQMLKMPEVKLCLLLQFAATGLFMGLFPHIGFTLQAGGDVHPLAISLVLSGFMIGSIAYSLLVKTLLTRLGAAKTILFAGAMAAAIFVAFGSGFSWPVQIAVFFGLGLSYRCAQNPLQTFAASVFPPLRGSLLALLSSVAALGQAAAPFLYDMAFRAVGTLGGAVAAAILTLAIFVQVARLLRSNARPE